MEALKTYSVGEVARLAGVSVRTLHHYDEVGLLSPSGRTAAGYRQYGHTDLERLQRVLAYRELGFGLPDIATIIDEPEPDPLDHLRRQHELLTGKIERLRRIVTAVEKAMDAHKMGINLDPAEMVEVFGDFDPTEHAEEAEQRWGETDAYQQSQRRVSGYSKADWKQLGAEVADMEQRLADTLAAGVAPDSAEAMALAEEHRQHMNRWFYDCSPTMHRGLGDMYVADPRFTAHYDDRAPGLARFLRDAIYANADRSNID
jgi:MerR family transcriptional regulator, thiopeptide resistance regulator